MTALPLPLRRERARVGVDRWGLVLAVSLAVGAAIAVGPRPLLIGLLWLSVVTPRLIAVDTAEHRLPDAIVLPGIPIALVAALGDGGGGTAVAAALGYAGVLLLLHVLGGMGLGDVKLAVPLGLLAGAAGPTAAVASPMLAFLVGGAISVVVLVRRGRAASIPFGPAMLLGAWLALLTV